MIVRPPGVLTVSSQFWNHCLIHISIKWITSNMKREYCLIFSLQISFQLFLDINQVSMTALWLYLLVYHLICVLRLQQKTSLQSRDLWLISKILSCGSHSLQLSDVGWAELKKPQGGGGNCQMSLQFGNPFHRADSQRQPPIPPMAPLVTNGHIGLPCSPVIDHEVRLIPSDSLMNNFCSLCLLRC